MPTDALHENTQEQICEINRKLDLVLEEMAYIRSARNTIEDLLNDGTLIGKDVYRKLTGSIGPTESIRMPEVTELAKVLVQNIHNFTMALQQLQSAVDFLSDAQPLAGNIYNSVLALFTDLEKKGYFRFVQGSAGIADAFVESHSQQDMQQAKTSIPHLIGFLRELTRPEVLQALESIVYGFGEVQASAKEKVSLSSLIRDINSPDARQGMAILVKFLKVVGARPALAPTKTTNYNCGE